MSAPARERAHGTRAKYVVERCRCEQCRRANREYQAARARNVAYGRETTNMVDPGPAREHVRALQAAGMGWRTVARAAGVSQGTMSRLLGYDPKGLSRIRRPTAARILAVTPALEPSALVDGTGTRRRLQALVAAGWPQAHLAARLGWDPANFNVLISGSLYPRVQHDTAQAVRELYDALWNVAPDCAPGFARRARGVAERRGWAPPLAWDDDTIDDPAAGAPDVRRSQIPLREPVDPFELTLLLERDARAHQVNPATRREAVRILTERGLSASQAAEHLGTDERTVTRIRAQLRYAERSRS